MTDPQPPDVGNPIPSMPLPPGCTTCGTQQTVTLDGRFGRRCEQHPPMRQAIVAELRHVLLARVAEDMADRILAIVAREPR